MFYHMGHDVLFYGIYIVDWSNILFSGSLYVYIYIYICGKVLGEPILLVDGIGKLKTRTNYSLCYVSSP